MSDFAITINEEAIKSFVNDTNGPIARALEFEAANTVEWDVRETINIPAPYFFRSGMKFYRPNPPEGPPFERTGDMWASVNHTRATRAGGYGIHVNVTVQEEHHGRDYPQILVDRGYIWIRRDNPRYTFVERT